MSFVPRETNKIYCRAVDTNNYRLLNIWLFSSFFISFSTELLNVLHYKSSYSSSVSVLQAFDPVRYKAFGFAMA